MGGLLSKNSCKPTETLHVPHGESCKRQKTLSSLWDDKPRLIPNLPDEISLEILARLPRICYLNVKGVSRSWKAAVTSSEIYKVRRELGTTEEWLYILTKNHGDKLFWHALDPVSKRWQRLPPVPNVHLEDDYKSGLSGSRMWNMVGSSIRIADAVRGWLGRKDGSDQIRFCGCAIGAVDGYLYMLGGFNRASAMNCVWKYDPVSNSWSEANPMSVGRAYCKTGVLNNKLYVVGGVSRGRGGLTPLQSAEVYDPQTGLWSEIPSMPFSKAQVLPTAFLADLLKPIATGLTSYRGKLYVPQSLYCWPFFVDVGGEVYDPETNSWADMPTGMGEGWPAKQAGTKLSVIVDGDLYALDPSSSLESAKIKVYDHQDDSWKVVDGDIPICDFAESESPYLLAGLLGKLHVITKDGNHNIAVMQADKQNDLMTSSGEEGEGTSESVTASDPNIWNVIAVRNSGSTELVSCQNLDI
ncbi:putative F-box domain, kelch-type beta propeller, F-box-like domain superfamily [Helianthus annuus]|nr:putative F-box domain, kelch-type beta propeller, F-box-like domain superfamily [Helianthus annuus]KAJ0599983.1 putative F-box domain, kelch-type beta propeller, F-box-like domain superfamily [Helianthus annuus]KAJ0607423.1 putative F-box domain, kelch-type beta propeller, F-box-like domain superfamily [Helianthus annuus]KAJ0767479.1 putative F-box domain, kelch-type beta propeller, F-box-like domain superfamily [Helianthus annuus]KAJ0773312.1 putative F-box domain, kelch-type beta propeller